MHRPVMREEVMEALNIKPTGIYVDATFGRGGHAADILQRLAAAGRLLAMDRDPAAVQAARARFADEPRFSIEQGSFASLHVYIQRLGLVGRIDGLLLDLGVSSPQLDDAQRGFSFRQDGPLDMRMDPTTGMSAAQWLAQAREAEITTVLRDYGEERYARRIARAIVQARAEAPIDTTRRLAEIVAAANPAWEKNKDPATRTFQALRIQINNELEELASCLSHVVDQLAHGGRLVVISFHSLEDRMVKRFIRQQQQGETLPRGLPVMLQHQPLLRRVGKALKPQPEEVRQNPRARSAIMRVAERVA